MRLDRIKLQNFRCFEELEFELHPEFTLLVGVNSSGKTSLLEALAVALGAWILEFPMLKTRNLTRDEMRRVKVVSGNVASLEIAGVTAVTAAGTVGGESLEWTRELRGARLTIQRGARRLRDMAVEANAKVASQQEVDLPVLAYYGTGRLWVQKQEREQPARVLGSRLEGYQACLDSASNHKRFERWMAWREEVRIQEISRALEAGRPADSVHEPLLEAVQNAASRCVEGARRFYYSVSHEELRLDMGDGSTLPFNMLSDGYRNLLAIAADIAWRAARLNPHYGAKVAELAQGVVLIDEIDLHLHPAWQRRVVEDLRRTFPRIQFVATTHSPQVISTVEPETIRVLQTSGGVGHVFHTRGRDTNTILREIMGAPDRPLWMLEKLEKIEKHIAEGDSAAARALLEEVKQDLGAHDRTVTGLEWEVHDLESVRRQVRVEWSSG
jgi:predicted ATP-binding protein involved in virulence